MSWQLLPPLSLLFGMPKGIIHISVQYHTGKWLSTTRIGKNIDVCVFGLALGRDTRKKRVAEQAVQIVHRASNRVSDAIARQGCQ